ncbi:type II toxin-antitoxin system VapB family antitoxin [Bradyrhizobium sp. AZCC 2289]|uniref:type II toxin-antitoxin system VapB family antitoxin n=1 Tax=Bradyrhizobium sp. AZCC 2289 TaxID=3117026 RepID=UPI002FF010CE
MLDVYMLNGTHRFEMTNHITRDRVRKNLLQIPKRSATGVDGQTVETAKKSLRTNIDIDDVLLAEAQKASGQPTKKQTVEQALRLMVRLRKQEEVDASFGRYHWRGNLRRRS